MSVKTINLEAAVWRAKSKLLDLLSDTVDLFEQFDRAVAVSHLSVSEGFSAGSTACYAIYECAGYAEADGDVDRAEKIGNVVSTFRNDLRVWYDVTHRNECADRKNWHDPNIENACVASWESRGGRYWVELWHGPYDYHYCSNNGGGSVCNPSFPLVAAVRVIQSMLDRGRFLPDGAKLPMKRVS